MIRRDLNIVVTEPAMLVGFNDVNEVASHLTNLGHGVLFDGYLLYAFKGDDQVKSVIITTGSDWGKLRLSVGYDSYKMLFCGFRYDKMDEFLEDFKSDKKLKVIYESLTRRFYEDKI